MESDIDHCHGRPMSITLHESLGSGAAGRWPASVTLACTDGSSAHDCEGSVYGCRIVQGRFVSRFAIRGFLTMRVAHFVVSSRMLFLVLSALVRLVGV